MSSRILQRIACASIRDSGLVLGGLLVLDSVNNAGLIRRTAGSVPRPRGHGGRPLPSGTARPWRCWDTGHGCASPKRVRSRRDGGGPASPRSPAGLGVWRHTVDHKYSAVSEAFIFNPAGVWTSTQRLTRLIQVGIGGDTFTDIVALEILDTNGNVIVTGCTLAVARRMEQVGESN